MSLEETTTRDDQDHDDQGSETASAITVNLTESDPKKAIDRSGSVLNDDGDGEERTPRNHKERKDDFAKRIGRLERGFDQRLAERDAEHQRELRELRGEINGLKAKRQDADSAADEATHNAKITDLESKLADALEAGDSKLTAKLQSAIAAEHARFASAQTAKAMGEGYERDQAERAKAAGGDNPKTNGPTPMGRRFLSANSDWWNDPANRGKKAVVVSIDAELLEEGFDPNTAEYYEELQARFNDDFPEFEIALPGERRRARSRVDDDDDDDLTTRQPRRAAVRTLSASANRGTAARPVNSRGRVVLGQAEIANMERFGMNPDNPEHVLAYAAEKRG